MSSSGFSNDCNDYGCKPQNSLLHFRKTTEILQDVVHMVLFVLIMCWAKYLGFGGF